MKRILRRPVTNVICISLFTAFYALIFIVSSNSVWFTDALSSSLPNQGALPFWDGWQGLLLAGGHVYFAYGMIALTILVIVLLMLRRHPYDEYHTSLLMSCLVVASVLTLVAIAVFYLMVLFDSSAIVAKFTLFIVVNWVTVVLSDLVFVLLCRWR